MSDINCNIIRDILPLYADEAVCEDTRHLVSNHLENCPECQRELEAMQQTIVLPMDTETGAIRHLKKGLAQTKRRTAALAVLCTTVFFLAAALFLILYRTPASSENIEVVTGSDEIGNFWKLDISSKDGAWLNVSRECLQASEEEGDVYRVYIYETLLPIPANSEFALNMGRYWETEPPEGYDVTVTLVFADKEVTYSMRELGQEYWYDQTEHGQMKMEEE